MKNLLLLYMKNLLLLYNILYIILLIWQQKNLNGVNPKDAFQKDAFIEDADPKNMFQNENLEEIKKKKCGW